MGNAMTAIHLANLVRQDPIADELWTERGNIQGVSKLSLDTYINQSLPTVDLVNTPEN